MTRLRVAAGWHVCVALLGAAHGCRVRASRLGGKSMYCASRCHVCVTCMSRLGGAAGASLLHVAYGWRVCGKRCEQHHRVLNPRMILDIARAITGWRCKKQVFSFGNFPPIRCKWLSRNACQILRGCEAMARPYNCCSRKAIPMDFCRQHQRQRPPGHKPEAGAGDWGERTTFGRGMKKGTSCSHRTREPGAKARRSPR